MSDRAGSAKRDPSKAYGSGESAERRPAADRAKGDRDHPADASASGAALRCFRQVHASSLRGRVGFNLEG